MFVDLVKKNIPANQVVDAGGLAYVSWANMLRGAGMPTHECVAFNNKPGLKVFDGVVVAVDMVTEAGKKQRTWLPVLDEENVAISANAAQGGTLSLLQSAIARCRAKAVAMVTGYGLSLYAGYGREGEKFFNDMGVVRDSEKPLVDVKPLADTKGDAGPEYLRWASAIAAARISDPGFEWEVKFFDDSKGGRQPYMEAGNGYFVAITTQFRGCSHTEILPIMDVWSYDPLENPTAADWNRAVMRCLAKAIATQTGYGISLYTQDEPVLEGHEPPSQEDLDLLEKTVLEKGRKVIDLLNWLGVEGEDLSVLTNEQCQRSLQAVGAKRPTAETSKTA